MVQESPISWRAAQETERMLEKVTRSLSWNLHLFHRRQVRWTSAGKPINETFSAYCRNVLVGPVLALFDQLRASRSHPPLECQVLESTDYSWVATICTSHEDSCDEDVTFDAPVLAFLSRGSIGPGHNPTTGPASTHKRLLQLAWDVNPRSRVLITDLESAFVVSPLAGDSHRAVLEPINLKNDLRVLRAAVAAYVHDTLPYCLGIDYMDIRPVPDRPQGPVAKPLTSLRPGHELFSTHRRQSDFDYVSFREDRKRARQLYEWNDHVLANVNPVFASAGDVLRGSTHAFSNLYPKLVSCYPIEDLPDDTLEHIRLAQRPICQERTMQALMASDRFAVGLTEDTTSTRSRSWMSRTYRCRVASIDDEPIQKDQSPKLFLKVFDDRFHLEEHLGAVESVRNEHSTYHRLSFMQGSLVPHYFGAHSFILPDGTEVYGILMEGVEAPPVVRGAGSLSPQHQVQLAQSVRHAVRGLQYADVTQHDWHKDQILFKAIPADDGASRVHCVLVDFAFTWQNTEEPGYLPNDDLGYALGSLLSSSVGMDEELVWNSYGARELWETVSFGIDFNGARECFPLPPDPLAFVYEP